MADRDRERDNERSLSNASSNHSFENVDGDVPLVPGYKNYLIYCDESGIHGARYYGFGSLWIPAERRGDLYDVIRVPRKRHGYTSEIKWNKVCRSNEAFYRDLLIAFFECKWMMFHALIVRRAYVDRSHHDGDFDLARRKHQTMLISNKVSYFNDGASNKSYHVRIDPIASRYRKADEVVHKIANYEVENEDGVTPISSLRVVDSKKSWGIQLCDFLLGATLAEWQGEVESDHKKRLVALLAHHLGWSDMQGDTYRNEAKFNIWNFHDPTTGASRERRTRALKLKFPMRMFQRTAR